MYIEVGRSAIQVERANFRAVVDFRKHVLQVGQFSPDFYVKLAGEGDYTVKYYIKATNLDGISRGSHIGHCDAVHYLGRFFNVYPGVAMIAGYSMNEGPNVLSMRFYYDGAGPVFLRCFLNVPEIRVEMQNAIVEFTR